MHSSTHSMVTRHCTTSPLASTLLPILSESFSLDRNQHTTVSPTVTDWRTPSSVQRFSACRQWHAHTHTDGQRADIMSWSHPQHTFSEMYLSQTNTVINSDSRPTTTLCRENFTWGSQLGQFRQGRAISAFQYGELDPVTGRLNLLEYWFFGRFCCSKFTQWVERQRSRLQLCVNTVCTNTAWHITT